ncbi:hypothetical protein PHLGIDRAFT_133798 [Phlebiopsis gigantea 11061_1 CR5-6]|uniref:Uncharacterized protein n=1 Tax=Phlebiopsis gigantea (strain 11061_1 CR5-6) TaxID=745531 RepID=A0A0C3S800_PHLG1|nr:hypothetical protein PHLGIDRAFT_133798 [Phlebiopsis gigantea 11061_1 CR5-6]
MFFNSGEIPVHLHTLTVTVESVSEDYPFLFDYLLFTPAPTVTSDALPASTSAPDASSSSSSSALAGTALSFSSSPPSTSSSSTSSSATASAILVNNASDHSTNHTGPIVGGVVGGIALLAIVSGFVWWWARRRAGSRVDSHEFDDKAVPAVGGTGGIPGVTPYLLPRDYNSSSANFVARETAAPLAPGSVLGRPETPTRPPKVPIPDVASPSSSTNFYDSQQRLPVAGGSSGPSDSSSGSGSGGASSGAFTQELADRDDRDVSARARPPKSSRLPARLAHTSPPAVHADSGLRFPRDTDPDEVLSQMTRGTQLPAYSPYTPS